MAEPCKGLRVRLIGQPTTGRLFESKARITGSAAKRNIYATPGLEYGLSIEISKDFDFEQADGLLLSIKIISLDITEKNDSFYMQSYYVDATSKHIRRQVIHNFDTIPIGKTSKQFAIPTNASPQAEDRISISISRGNLAEGTPLHATKMSDLSRENPNYRIMKSTAKFIISSEQFQRGSTAASYHYKNKRAHAVDATERDETAVIRPTKSSNPEEGSSPKVKPTSSTNPSSVTAQRDAVPTPALPIKSQKENSSDEEDTENMEDDGWYDIVNGNLTTDPEAAEDGNYVVVN